MKKMLLLIALSMLLTYCEKEDDENNMTRTTPGYIASDCEGF